LAWIGHFVSVYGKQAGKGLGDAVVQGRGAKGKPLKPMLLQVADVAQFRWHWP
jgi:hypothetical protein